MKAILASILVFSSSAAAFSTLTMTFAVGKKKEGPNPTVPNKVSVKLFTFINPIQIHVCNRSYYRTW